MVMHCALQADLLAVEDIRHHKDCATRRQCRRTTNYREAYLCISIAFAVEYDSGPLCQGQCAQPPTGVKLGVGRKRPGRCALRLTQETPTGSVAHRRQPSTPSDAAQFGALRDLRSRLAVRSASAQS